MGAQSPIGIAIVDDHPIARYGIGLALKNDPGMSVVCTASSISQFRQSVDGTDVVILDLYLQDGRVAGSEISSMARRWSVLVVSASAKAADVLAAIHVGARGYVTKSSSGHTYVEAVRTVARGGFYVSPELADLIYARTESTAARPNRSTAMLTPRERETLALIAEGFTQAQAASRMSVSPATIDTYLKRIRQKLGPGNKADLTRRAMQMDESWPGDGLPYSLSING